MYMYLETLLLLCTVYAQAVTWHICSCNRGTLVTVLGTLVTWTGTLATATEAHWQVKFVHSDVTDGGVYTLQAIAVGAETQSNVK